MSLVFPYTMEFLQEYVFRIWVDGGYLMVPLALLGLIIYGAIFELFLYLSRNDFALQSVDEWKHWIDRPEEAHGPLQHVLQYAQHEVRSDDDVRARMDEIRAAHLPVLDTRIRFAAVLVGTAPLMGLLGTVVGMLATFAGLAISAGGQTIDLVAGGISAALITTQTGLVLAIPGYVLLNNVRRKRDAFALFLTQVEILTLKRRHRLANQGEPLSA